VICDPGFDPSASAPPASRMIPGTAGAWQCVGLAVVILVPWFTLVMPRLFKLL
jgi:hypothetical protein